jgi:unsaturated chondroitin disaccharide hydrolase
MDMVKRYFVRSGVFVLLLTALSASAQSPSFPALPTDANLLRTIDSNLNNACRQYKVLMTHIPSDSLPRSFADFQGRWISSDPGWWTSGFFTATLLELFSFSGDSVLLQEGIRRMALLTAQQYNRHTHDLGFMMFDSYGLAYRLHRDSAYATILMNSARSLATRFNPIVGCIRSWDGTRWQFPVIIDNMMNLELLCWATAYSGDSSFLRIAEAHANTTLQHHYRPDYSSYHVVDYDTLTGAVRGRQTAQGYSDASAWARGQAWGLYGFTAMYRATKDSAYLSEAIHIARYILSHPNLPADGVPYWDFDAPDIPHTYRDASAGAIMASAFIELSEWAPPTLGKSYLRAAETILRTLSGAGYQASGGNNGGFLLRHSVGNLPGHTEVDVSLTYADYYFVEAMLRYKALTKGPH